MSENFEPFNNSINILSDLPSKIEFSYKKLKSYNIQSKNPYTKIKARKAESQLIIPTRDNFIINNIHEKIRKSKGNENKNLLYDSYIIFRQNSKNDKNIENFLKDKNNTEFSEKEKNEMYMIKNKIKRNYSSAGFENSNTSCGTRYKISVLHDYFNK